MRFIFKSLVVILLVLGVGNYLVYLKTGQFPITAIRENYNGDWLAALKESFSPDDLVSTAKKTVDDLTNDEADKPAPTKVYKWTDADGVVHYGDRPDTAGAEQVEVKIQNAISADEIQSKPASSSASQTPLEKARAAAESMKVRSQQQEAN
ncbi:MAG: hypothetical protein B0W54_02190 [Cellvibrio sp. 79]|nr:MAG: hypothetical protein B0W54_02190 [Cellvibrio sp. 79]